MALGSEVRPARRFSPSWRLKATPSCLRNAYLDICPDGNTINGPDNAGEGALNPRPACRHQYHYRDAPRIQMLLVSQIGISGDQNFIAFTHCRIKKIAVRESRPSLLVCSGDFMLREKVPQWYRRTLIKKYSHLRWCQRTARSVFKDRTHLI